MKEKVFESVIHDWVSNLTFQQQALLMTGMRGPDGSEKHNSAKIIIRFLRGIVLKPAGNWHRGNDNDFMWGDYSVFNKYSKEFWDNHDHYPHHFIMHLVHCAQVVGYKHPEQYYRLSWINFYLRACKSFHMEPESVEKMDRRLNDFQPVDQTV